MENATPYTWAHLTNFVSELTPAQLARPVSVIIGAHGDRKLTQVSSVVVPESAHQHPLVLVVTEAPESELFGRFKSQWELLTGGPKEFGKETYNKVLDAAKQNVFDGVQLAEDEAELTIGLGSNILRAVYAVNQEEVFYNVSFGWVAGKQNATGYTSKADANTSKRVQGSLCRNLIKLEVVQYKDA